MKLAALKYWNWFCILNQKERILLIPQVNCGSELLDVVWHPEPETSYPADPPKCTQAGFDPPKCTEAEIDPPNGSRSVHVQSYSKTKDDKLAFYRTAVWYR